MKATKSRVTDEERILKTLSEQFSPKSITVHRHNWASIHVRVIDRRFGGKSIVQREAMVDALLDKLPEDIQAELTILLLLSPKEAKESPLNREFGAAAATVL